MASARRVVLILLGISLLAGVMTGSQLYYRLTYLWALLLVGSWVMSRMALRGLDVNRKARFLRSQVGQIFEERFEIVNTSRLPRLWIEVRDESSLPGTRGSHVLTLIGGRESRTYLARTRLSDRGVFPLGPTELVSGDLFGLFQVNRVYPSMQNLLVFPMMFQVQSFPNPPGLLPGGEALRRRTAQITSNAAGVREYEPGDPMNRIHWVSTARRDRLMVKEFELDPLAEVWIFVDGAGSVQAALPQEEKEFDPQDVWRHRYKFQLPPSTIEYSVSIAASLARFYLRRGRAVGLASSGQALRVLPADRGGRQLGKILESLAVLRAEGNLYLSGLIETQARHLPRGSTIIMVTPSTFDDVIQTADILLRKGLRPVAVLVDPKTFGGMRSNESLAFDLKALGVPVCQVSNGEDLSNVLSDACSNQMWG
jgi:uncharacterized protein (DUF58 family)